MSQELYYIAPSQEVFDDMKAACIAVWQTYDDTYSYATEKINRIKDIENVSDNFMYMMAMFDENNMERALTLVSPETQEEFNKRMI